MPTLPVTASPPPETTLDAILARGLTASELATCSAYAAWTKQPLLVWVAKMRRGAL